MLKLKQINKEYKTGELVQHALNDVSLNLRDNEFVAILGPSGSGKTTLLNVIGGLDRYDSGDLIINGISTKKYTDRDWDSYRNHTIGFVFQSYNLIPHQTVLSNVELALTISGISGAERRSRATKALEQVGLGDQLHKHPSEMSGGQLQRLAIARALLADLRTHSLAEGGSTLTQQLAKNELFTQDKHLARKAAEMLAAFDLEKTYSKQQIFEMYANTIYFGSGYYGIAEAAEGYFGKEPAQLTDAEAIYLAGMPNAPSTYASSPELAFKRMQVVLKRMVKCRVLTQQQADAIAADAENLTV